jgi:hypothetical protein
VEVVKKPVGVSDIELSCWARVFTILPSITLNVATAVTPLTTTIAPKSFNTLLVFITIFEFLIVDFLFFVLFDDAKIHKFKLIKLKWDEILTFSIKKGAKN